MKNGEAIKAIHFLASQREQKKMTLTEASDKLDIMIETLSKYEKDLTKMPVGTFYKYADLLGFDIKLIVK